MYSRRPCDDWALLVRPVVSVFIFMFSLAGGNMRAMTGFVFMDIHVITLDVLLLIINVFYRQPFPMLSCTVRIRHLYCHLLFGWAMIGEWSF
jgi:hypothetical protein